MSDVTVAQFAEVLKVSVERLLTQLEEAGVAVGGPDEIISDDVKMELLNHLRNSHGKQSEEKSSVAPAKITLNRRAKTELKLSGGKGAARTVNVEVRRKRTYVKRDVLEEQARQQQEEIDGVRRAEEEKRDAERLEVERQEQERRAVDEAAKRKIEEERQLQQKQADARRQAEAEARNPGAPARAEPAASPKRAKRVRGDDVVQKREPEDKGAATLHGRRELHVAGGMAGKRRLKKQRRRPLSVNVEGSHGFERPTEPQRREVAIPESITVGELAQRMAIKASEVMKVMMQLGFMATINQSIDQDTAVLVVEEMGHAAKTASVAMMDDQIIGQVEVGGDAVARAPVVTIMGHVDHGKTSLLDYIRRTKVAAGEAGGITQHIGAYSVKTDRGQITFLDTPGHAAFTAMRARGAKVTDIVILVVAADDGVMPQTEEAVQHAKAAGVPLIVAVNKTDREDADPDRVRSELAALNVIPDTWGGDTMFINVSALTGAGVDDLLEAILLQAEVLELKSVAEGNAAGVVIESSLETGRGNVVTLLVTRGTLKQGDSLVAGAVYGRVRRMFDDTGADLIEAGPSMPVAVLGLSGMPNSGDEVTVVPDERKAREVAQIRYTRSRDLKLAQQVTRVEDVFSQMQAGAAKNLQILVKADVHGSAEALRDSLTKIITDEVVVKVVSSGVGAITESDISLAAASKAIVIGFNVRADSSARAVIKESGVKVLYFSIIYEAIDAIKTSVTSMLTPEVREQIIGLAEVRDVFQSPKFGDIAGCLVVDGYVKRSSPIRVLRSSVVIYEGELESLRRFKDNVNEVKSGTECGIGVRNYTDVKPGDQIECFERIEVARTL